KKIFFATLIAASLTSVGVFAQGKVDTLKNKVDVTSQLDTILIQIPSRSSERKHVHLDFDIPFYNKINSNGTNSLVGAMGVGAIFSNSKAPLDFSPQNSLEFYMYSLDSHTRGRSTFSFGPGITFRNLGLTGGNAMSMAEDGKISVAPFQGGALKVSKLRVFSLNAPLLYSFDLGGGFGFTLGPVVNLNTGSSIVNKYSVAEDNPKEKTKRVHCNIITVDAMFQLNLKYFSIYAKYSPMNLMDNKYWPEFTTWSIGIAPF
ncbi:MAG: hypothetical protein J5886_04255, partial [Bacteroidales bacterium]|nr:hypothetical protein [Bacteroidales bacterium]